MEDTKVFLDSRLTLSREAFVQFGRLYFTILSFIGKDNLQKLIKDNREVFINVVENIADDFPISKTVLLRFLQISNKRYTSWLSDRKFACSKSLTGQCFKRRPNQISPKEIQTLKTYMNNPNYKIWCIRSVWGKAVRMVQFLWQNLLGINILGNLGFLKHESLLKYLGKEVHLMLLDQMKPGIWIYLNTKLLIMSFITSIPWLITSLVKLLPMIFLLKICTD